MTKNTWRFWIMSSEGREGRYYIFKSRKVYFAYYEWLYSDKRKLQQLEERYESCKKNKSLVATFFNNTTTLEQIERMIIELKNKINNA